MGLSSPNGSGIILEYGAAQIRQFYPEHSQGDLSHACAAAPSANG